MMNQRHKEAEMKLIGKPAHGSFEWLALRHRNAAGNIVFGASEIPALMGMSQWMTRPELFASKLREPEVRKETDVFRRGNLLEPVLIQEAGTVLGLPIVTPEFMYAENRVIATLDGVDAPLSPTIIVEAKTTTRYRIRDVEDLPAEWLWQGWAQQYATSKDGHVPSVYFAVLDSDQKISVLEAPNNPDAIERLATEAEAFAAAIERNEPPAEFDEAVMDAATVATIWRETPTEVEIPEVEMRWLQELALAKDMAAEADTLKKHAEDQIALMLKNHEVGTFRGVKVVSWKEQAGRASLDTKALREAHPEIAAKFDKQGKPFRVMRTHKIAPTS